MFNKKNFLLINISILTLLSISSSAFAIDEKQAAENPKPASASVYNLGLKSYEQGDVTSAISFFKRAVDLDPNFIDAYYNLGAIYKKQKNYVEAISSLQKAVDLNPKDEDAKYELAYCYMEEKNYEKAKKYYSTISITFPKYSEVAKNITLIDQYLAGSEQQRILANTQKPEAGLDISQAQILADTLVEEKEAPKKKHENLLVNALTKSSRENLKEPIKIISDTFNGPTGIAKDSKNNIYVANFVKDSIERIRTDGTKEIFLDKVGLLGPVGLAIDEDDNIYVANYNGNSIVRITQDREVIVLVDKITRPYYLFYDKRVNKLFATVQGNDSLIEIDTRNIGKLPITFR